MGITSIYEIVSKATPQCVVRAWLEENVHHVLGSARCCMRCIKVRTEARVEHTLVKVNQENRPMKCCQLGSLGSYT